MVSGTQVFEKFPRVSGRDVYKYYLCPKKVELDRFGDQTVTAPIPIFLQRRMASGVAFEKAVIGKLTPPCADVSSGSLHDRFERTLKLMTEGRQYIYQGVLHVAKVPDLERSAPLWGEPDLLYRVTDYHSCFGQYAYEVADIKSYKDIAEKELAQIGFYSCLLAIIQKTRPRKACIINKNEEWKAYREDQYHDLALNALDEVNKILRKETKPIGLRCDHCPDCAWRKFCYQEAQDRECVTLINGIRRDKAQPLIQAGFDTITKLATATFEQLEAIHGIGKVLSHRFKRQAHVLKTKKMEVLDIPEFPETLYDIVLDFEGDIYTKQVYLAGVLVKFNRNVWKKRCLERRGRMRRRIAWLYPILYAIRHPLMLGDEFFENKIKQKRCYVRDCFLWLYNQMNRFRNLWRKCLGRPLVKVIQGEQWEKVEIIQFFASHPEKIKRKIFKSLLRLLSRYPDYTVYHYDNYDKSVLNHMKKQYGDFKGLDKLMANLCDLKDVVEKTVVLPLTSYTLKEVASYLCGCTWRSNQVEIVSENASNSIVLYNELQETSKVKAKRKIFQEILDYNEDDINATIRLKPALQNLKK